jgi:hypothetical protein
LNDTNNSQTPDPEETAEELAFLARHTPNPGARIWYLEWAKAFQRLAQRRADQPARPDERREDN